MGARISALIIEPLIGAGVIALSILAIKEQDKKKYTHSKELASISIVVIILLILINLSISIFAV